MIEDPKRGKFNRIYTKSISRFGRNVKDILNTIDELTQCGVGVYFEDVQIDTLIKNDNFKLLIFAGLAEEESRLKSLGVHLCKITAAKNKQIWSGREPYGYKIVQGRLQVNRLESIFVKRMFYLYLLDSRRNITIQSEETT